MKISHSLWFAVLSCLALRSLAPSASANSATWNLDPVDNNWNNHDNWTPATVPHGDNDVASFGVSNTTAIQLSTINQIDRVVFNSGASAYTITCSAQAKLGLLGKGILNQSGSTQTIHITNAGNLYFFGLEFFGTATAGSNVLYTTELDPNGPEIEIAFTENSTAGNATFILNGAVTPGGTYEARCTFFNSSNAGHANFTLQGGEISQGDGGSVYFGETCSVSTATITANGSAVSGGLGGLILLSGSATADNSTLVANGGVNGGLGSAILCVEDSTGGNARARVNGNAKLDISCHNAPGMGIGSIEGNGLVYLGSNALTVGSNDRDAMFSGTMSDGGGSCRGRGGSLVKVGSGRLTLSRKSAYTGSTTVLEGTLTVSNTSGSATGSGPVNVNAGTLSGRGIIGGSVAIGSASDFGAVIAPSGLTDADPGTLTIKSALTFDSDGQYECGVDSSAATADKTVANGVTIDPAAQFFLTDSATGTLAIGTVFTVMDNTGATPIGGTFSNLPNGAIVAVNGNKFQASYSGGDGNDLTLTVVP